MDRPVLNKYDLRDYRRMSDNQIQRELEVIETLDLEQLKDVIRDFSLGHTWFFGGVLKNPMTGFLRARYNRLCLAG